MHGRASGREGVDHGARDLLGGKAADADPGAVHHPGVDGRREPAVQADGTHGARGHGEFDRNSASGGERGDSSGQ
mgnify:CR=1 FL=1